MKKLFYLLSAIVVLCLSGAPQDFGPAQCVDPEKLKPLLPQIGMVGRDRQAPTSETTMGLASYVEVRWIDPAPSDKKPVENEIVASIRDTGYFANSYPGKYFPEPDSKTPSGGLIQSVTVKGKYPGRRTTGSNPSSCWLIFLVAGRFEVDVRGRSCGEADALLNAIDLQALEKFAAKK